jgi:hypothetical protein
LPQLRRPRLTYANVASSVALFLAVSGGTAFAAATIGSSQIRNGAVTNGKIANSAVTGAKVRTGSITSSDIKNGSLRSSDFASGQLPAGPAGPAGAAGAAGPAGAAGAGSSMNGVVSPAGTLVYGTGVTAVSVGGSGVYTVTFSENVSQCPVVATIGGYQLGGNTASATDGGTVSLQPGGNNTATAAQQVTFVTRSLAGVNVPLPFHFGVFC